VSNDLRSCQDTLIRTPLDVIDSSCEDKTYTPVLYLIIPSDFVTVHPMEYAYIVEALKDSKRLVHQFIPIDVVHRTSWAEDEIGAFVTSTYDRCKSRLERNVHRKEFEPLGRDGSWIRPPAFTIAQPMTPQFRYSLNGETRGIDTADCHVLLHAGYGFSSSGKWLFAACIDQRGESHCLRCWDIDELDCGSERDDKVVLILWNFIEESTQSLSAEWVAVICKLGRLRFAEIKG
jgi:mediator of RNA polymerase II transcription subunit 13